jgi:hypothetical protein
MQSFGYQAIYKIEIWRLTKGTRYAKMFGESSKTVLVLAKKSQLPTTLAGIRYGILREYDILSYSEYKMPRDSTLEETNSRILLVEGASREVAHAYL